MAYAMHARGATRQYWNDKWSSLDIKGWYKLTTFDGFYPRLFRRYIRRGQRVLEAGCGLGQWVDFLRRRGVDAVGVDFDAETIRRVRKAIPRAPLRCADVRSLPFNTGWFDTVLSFGVVEHFQEGPDAALREAYRVLRPGGILLCSVPYYNPLRRWFTKTRQETPCGDFYQYLFTPAEVREFLRRHGFRILRVHYYGIGKGFKDELRWLTPAYRAYDRQVARNINGSSRSTLSQWVLRVKQELPLLLSYTPLPWFGANILLAVARKKR